MKRFHGILAAALTLGGCTFGRNFEIPPDDQLVLGKTTEVELRTRMGKPIVEENIEWNEHALTAWTYFYGTQAGVSAPHVGGITPCRGMNVFFLKGVLVGYDRWSSFQEGHTDFEHGQIAALMQSAAAEKDVTERLGPATGRYAYPLVKTPTHGGRTWTYLHLTGNKIVRKHLVLTVDADGRIVDLEYRSTSPN